ncbi:MAG: ferrous iron transport protein B [Verrucomicrobiota bacterium]
MLHATDKPTPGGTPLPCIVLTGNPNCGKTTVFNALTGLRAKVGNYAGVTVERKEGRLKDAPTGFEANVLDLPGTYSLSPKSLDEQVSRDVLLQHLPEVPAPTVVVVICDASNLERNLYYATQVIELGYPTLLVLNMVDVAKSNGQTIKVPELSHALGVPVLPMVASKGEGVAELKKALVQAAKSAPAPPAPKSFCTLPAAFQTEVNALALALRRLPNPTTIHPPAEALMLLADERAFSGGEGRYAEPLAGLVATARQRLEATGVDWRSATIEARYERITQIHLATAEQPGSDQESFSDRLDRVITHRVWGLVIFIAVMALMFQCIFVFAKLPMDLIDTGIHNLAAWVALTLPTGMLTDLLVNGVISGVGAVVVFLPQILMLFLFISLLEDTGYMARAAFIMDHIMSKVGLHGKSFIPMLSSFACAIPGIMAARTIENQKDRLATILIAPLMSCSARLPVYSVLIAACIPDTTLLGFIKLQGATMLAMYLLGVLMALAMAWLFKKTFLKSAVPLLILELPPYKRPVPSALLHHVWERGKIFLQQAGTIILGINIILWFLATYPRHPEITNTYDLKRDAVVAAAYPQLASTESVSAKIKELQAQYKDGGPATNDPAYTVYTRLREVDNQKSGETMRLSFLGRLGRLIEPLIQPLGFDWKIGVGILSSFAAREVFVSTMSIVYNAGGSDAGLVTVMREQTHPDGTVVYTTLQGITLMVFYVLALQCASTVIIVRRETNSWKWPIFQWCYLGVLAWVMSFLVYQGGKLLGWG